MPLIDPPMLAILRDAGYGWAADEVDQLRARLEYVEAERDDAVAKLAELQAEQDEATAIDGITLAGIVDFDEEADR